MSLSHNRTMSLPELRARIQTRIHALEERLNALDPESEPKAYKFTKDELAVNRRRLERIGTVSQGPAVMARGGVE